MTSVVTPAESFRHAVRAMIEQRLGGVRTIAPAEVISVADDKVDVRILVGRGDILKDMYVISPGSSGAAVVWTLKAGDRGLVLFNDRDISEWTPAGGAAAMPSGRLLDISDGMFLPCFNEGVVQISASDNKLRIDVQGQSLLPKITALLDSLLSIAESLNTTPVAGVGAPLAAPAVVQELIESRQQIEVLRSLI